LTPAYRGPYWVLERGARFFKVQLGTSADSISVNRLKPYLGSEPVMAAHHAAAALLILDSFTWGLS
jgi:hypothetical protein